VPNLERALGSLVDRCDAAAITGTLPKLTRQVSTVPALRTAQRVITRSPLLLAFMLGSMVMLINRSVRGDDAPPARTRLEFDRDIRPILSNHCYKCHGPDEDVRESGLRLDVREGLRAPADSGEPAVLPGKAGESNLIKRVFSTNKSFVMPPPKADKPLSEDQKARLRAWVDQGAEYTSHWSFSAPVRPEPPEVAARSWPRHPIDRFILARLEREGLSPSPEADRTTLIRRLAFDLTGLPPTPAQVDAFLNDKAAGAYERLVDRFLSDPHFGERLTVDWLDAARFADTHGFHIDSGRDMTRWRAWVINAFNQNLPYDRFVVEQLAGDLLPNPSVEQKIASGFNRNHMINFEGGAIPEEYHTAYIIDRVNTTGTVFLGLTVACAQCHDHKFDPFTQKDFYRLYAFFNNVPEKGLDGSKGNAEPLLKTPSPEQRQEIEGIASSIREIESRLSGPMPEVDVAQVTWESHAAASQAVAWTVVDPLDAKASSGARFKSMDDKSLLVEGANPANDIYTFGIRTDRKAITAFRLEALPDDGLVEKGPGRSSNGNFVLSEVKVSAAPSADPTTSKVIALKGASADFSQKDYPITNAIDGRVGTGWAIHPAVGKLHSAIFEFASPVDDGAALTVSLDFRSEYGQHQIGRLRLSTTSDADPRATNPIPPKVRAILAEMRESRSDAEQVELRTYFRHNHSPECQAEYTRVASLRARQAEIEKQIPTTMIMAEMAKPRDTFMLVRGQYDKKGDQVAPGVPSFLPPLPADASPNRLGLARWLVDPRHPLTARVAVNRFWQMIFGTGIVRTSEDLGSQGESPTHPELLDWLAVEFVDPSQPNVGRWDIKALIRLMVTSATYRQSSVVTPDRLAKDPENRLLARGPRVRLQAEFVRDQALAVSGLLKDSIGGKSVSPYQPAGLWEELMSRADGANWTAQVYKQDHGADLYRRTMYTFWKRTSPPPTLATFDAPDRETCTVRRARTNTPLQALVLLNDPTYVEASRKLGERMMTEAGPSIEERIAFAFRLATARPPRDAELVVLQGIYQDALKRFRADRAAALKLLAVGESPRNDKLDTAELAAWSAVASVILNLDETVTKG
jgi:hypothetical protein